MGRKLLSIDIGNNYIHVIEGEAVKGITEISKAFQIPSPQGSIVNGKLENIDILATAIKTALDEHKCRTEDAVLSVQGDSGLTREMILPRVKDSAYDQMVKFEMSQFLPSDVDNFIIQYMVIEDSTPDNPNSSRIWVAALNTSIVDKYYELLLKIGLKPVSLGLHSSSVFKLFRGNSNQTAAFIDFGHRNTGINIVSNGKLELNRNIGIGGHDIDTSISSQCSTGFEKAIEIKTTLVNLNDNAAEESKAANTAVRSTVNHWISEIQKVLQFYDSRRKSDSIQTIYLYGGSSQLQGLDEYLSRVLNIQAIRLSSTEKVRYMGKEKSFKVHNYINCAGAMIGC